MILNLYTQQLNISTFCVLASWFYTKSLMTLDRVWRNFLWPPYPDLYVLFGCAFSDLQVYSTRIVEPASGCFPHKSEAEAVAAEAQTMPNSLM